MVGLMVKRSPKTPVSRIVRARFEVSRGDLADSYLADRSLSQLSWRCGYRRIGSRCPTDHHRGVIVSTSEMLPDSSSFAPLVANMLPEIKIGTARPAELSPAVEGPEPSSSVANELSARELEVLRYLPTMLTAGEIAAELYVSVNTIKAHTRSIYRKLGASRRQVAVVRAYQSGILRPRSFVPPPADADPLAEPTVHRSYDH
jgi:DNA-binding CsgD family transcriptional regulator